ncbi:hypothetical protein MBLNU459_g7835t1 [Dothideomycetes sp. NU459]
MPEQQGKLNFVVYDQSTGSDARKQVRAQAARVGWSARKQSGKIAGRKFNGVNKKPKTKGITYQLERFEELDAAYPAQSLFSATPGLFQAATNTHSLSHNASSSASITNHSPAGLFGAELSSATRARHLSPFSAADDVDNSSSGEVVEEISRSRPGTSYFDVVLNQDYIMYDQPGFGTDPCWSLPVKWRPFYGIIADYWQNTVSQVMMNEIQTGFKGRDKKTRVMDLLHCAIATNSPALFYGFYIFIIAMLPDRHPLSRRNIPFFAQWLKAKAVQTLNSAISDPKRIYDCTTIGAVNCVAFCESVHGSVQVARDVHQRALRNMIAARGGLDRIEASSPHGSYMRAATLQLDRLIASKSGIPKFFPEYHDAIVDSTNWDGVWTRVQWQLGQLC